ncbi:MAG: hypothetical protein ACAH95_16165 [Fimbriimonas sp.]
MRKFAVLTAAGLAVAASACMWDYDTFAVEASGKHDLVAVLAGRFERNPPLYYEMRLTHGLEELRRNPGDLEMYDNAAVAAERLGKHDQALAIISQKREHLKPLPADKDGWYRYFANIGTFHAHRAMSVRDQKERLADLKLAEKEIASAIEINPESHFGREKYQLYAIRWILSGVPHNMPFWDYLIEQGVAERKKEEDAIRGLSGLIRLGGAWESVDIWATLAVLLRNHQDNSLVFYAFDRVEELEKSGKKSLLNVHKLEGELDSLSEERERGYSPSDTLKPKNKIIYADLRRQADEWHTARTAYMMERLKNGRHPDWDKNFWAEWEDEPKLQVPSPGFIESIPFETKMWGGVVTVLVLLVASPFVLFFGGRKLWRKWKLSRASQTRPA